MFVCGGRFDFFLDELEVYVIFKVVFDVFFEEVNDAGAEQVLASVFFQRVADALSLLVEFLQLTP